MIGRQLKLRDGMRKGCVGFWVPTSQGYFRDISGFGQHIFGDQATYTGTIFPLPHSTAIQYGIRSNQTQTWERQISNCSAIRSLKKAGTDIFTFACMFYINALGTNIGGAFGIAVPAGNIFMIQRNSGSGIICRYGEDVTAQFTNVWSIGNTVLVIGSYDGNTGAAHTTVWDYVNGRQTSGEDAPSLGADLLASDAFIGIAKERTSNSIYYSDTTLMFAGLWNYGTEPFPNTLENILLKSVVTPATIISDILYYDSWQSKLVYKPPFVEPIQSFVEISRPFT